MTLVISLPSLSTGLPASGFFPFPFTIHSTIQVPFLKCKLYFAFLLHDLAQQFTTVPGSSPALRMACSPRPFGVQPCLPPSSVSSAPTLLPALDTPSYKCVVSLHASRTSHMLFPLPGKPFCLLSSQQTLFTLYRGLKYRLPQPFQTELITALTYFCRNRNCHSYQLCCWNEPFTAGSSARR